jgi:hypothetical protein
MAEVSSSRYQDLTRQEAYGLEARTLLRMANGASFTGPLAVGQNIKISYEAASSSPQEDLRNRLEEMIAVTSKMIEALETEQQKIDASTQLKALVEEAKKDKPSKWMLDASKEGLLKSASTVATMVTAVSKAIAAVMALVA